VDLNEDNDFLFLFVNFGIVFQNSTPEKFANIWRIERVGMSAIEFEVARIHFLSDVFVDVAVVVAQAPYYYLEAWNRLRSSMSKN